MKIITVPITKEAQELLDIDNCPSDMLEEFQISQKDFDRLWQAGLFALINMSSGAMIDDYEYDSIQNPRKLEAALQSIEKRVWTNELDELIKNIKALFVKAIEYKTSIHFYF
ncbi:MAG: hypothetical protein OQJ95_03465 [Kangiella sp.]|jgi:hypothetical protein|nr:hypothetical protein [Kangiella sp.]MCW9029786.1 hypothetical protein [Kangiella sp.]